MSATSNSAAARKLRSERFQHLESQALLDALNRVYKDYSPTPEEQEVRRLLKQKQRERMIAPAEDPE